MRNILTPGGASFYRKIMISPLQNSIVCNGVMVKLLVVKIYKPAFDCDHLEGKVRVQLCLRLLFDTNLK